MRKTIICFTTGILSVFSGCTGDHLINNKEYRSKVDASFAERKQLANHRTKELFSVFKTPLTPERREALEFLIAYMPLSDLADYNGDFFLANADIALRTRKESPWGKEVPEDIFLHYILPIRVNNENLDSFRIAYYNEITKRVKGLDEFSSALEINHWCHEKVAYQPSDIRTSGPLGTILSARGRCGEESTFTVAALRTAGIPARQVYTPRWAHCDDNHAWVEVWLKGVWYYMGACEPEPVLDRGWFTEPARRAMLVHTKSFGATNGNENTIVHYRNYSDINNLSKYAVTKCIYVKVMDHQNRLVKGAQVEYQLYNYAEFYPLAVVPTDENGISRFETGLGDLLIWARKGDDFNFRKITVSETDTLTLTIDRKASENDHLDLDLGVPVLRKPFEAPPVKLIEDNNIRINKENQIRQTYTDSWMKMDDAADLAKKIGADSALLKDIIRRSMGNFRNISEFLLEAPSDEKQLAIKILTLISDKDLRDIKKEVLSDHLDNSVKYSNTASTFDEELYYDYVLNPRIANENIVPWRKLLKDNFDSDFRKKVTDNPSTIIDFINDRIIPDDTDNYYKTPLTPRGVNELRVSDRLSRDIYFVAICRSLGIPSRLEPGNNIPQYYFNRKWIDACFNGEKKPAEGKGYLKLISGDKHPVPEYYIHFTIARFYDGRYNTLDYDYNKRINDFRSELVLIPGHYMLVTGNRINDSKILSSISFFELGENEHKVLNVSLRQNNSGSH
jgi:transglutaminase-like putative cysteine protease